MKFILLILLLTSSAFAQIEIISATEVRENGKNIGAPIDCIRNRPELASQIQVALQASFTAQQASIAAKDSEVSKAKGEKAVAEAKTAEIVAAAKSEDPDTIAEAARKAELSEQARKKEQLKAELDEKQAEIDKLEVESAKPNVQIK